MSYNFYPFVAQKIKEEIIEKSVEGKIIKKKVYFKVLSLQNISKKDFESKKDYIQNQLSILLNISKEDIMLEFKQKNILNFHFKIQNEDDKKQFELYKNSENFKKQLINLLTEKNIVKEENQININ